MKRLLLACVAAVALGGSAHATTIGVSMAKFDDSFLTGVRSAIVDAAKANGVTAHFEDAQDDSSKQLSQIRTYIARKVDAIIVNAVDTSATPRMTRLAAAAGIPLVYVNRRPEDHPLPSGIAYVGSNETVAGTLEGEGLVKCLSGKGNIVIMQGQLTNNAALDRTAAIEAVVAKNPDIKIVGKQTANWDRNQALDLMRSWLTSGDPIAGVAANNDEMAIGAIQALKQAGQDPRKTCVGGVDATASGLSEVQNGSLYVTVFQNAKAQGTSALDTALRMIKGETVSPYVDIPFEKVTQDNYRTYLTK